MRKGTTPTYRFKLPFDSSLIAVAKVTFEQDGVTVERKDGTIDGDILTVKLTQEETFKFKGDVYARCNVRILTKDNTALSSEFFHVFVRECLDDEVLKV